jgi:hypothetical protein
MRVLRGLGPMARLGRDCNSTMGMGNTAETDSVRGGWAGEAGTAHIVHSRGGGHKWGSR